MHIVEEIAAKFRSGEQDKAGVRLTSLKCSSISSTAVRDKQGRFRGVLEMMQDCTHIRELTGLTDLADMGW